VSILAGVTSGASTSGLRVVVYAQEKMGKTTLGAGAPNALLVPLEVGFAGVSVHKTPMLQSLAQVKEFLTEVYTALTAGQFPFRSIVFDSATALERYIHEAVLASDPSVVQSNGRKTVTMESAHGGYGKAYLLANAEFSQILGFLDVLAVQFGINIVFTCHAFSSRLLDPTAGEFDSWDILLHSPKNAKTYGKREIITQWADIVGFIYEPIVVSESGRVSRGVSQNRGRLIGVSRTPAYVAGNRFGMVEEIKLPTPPNNSWNALANAVYSSTGIDVFNRDKP